MIDFLATKKASRFTGWVRVSLVCVSLVCTPAIERGLAIYFESINASLAGQIIETSPANMSAMSSRVTRCSEELGALRGEVERYPIERQSLIYPGLLMRALGDALPAHAWLERVSMKGIEVTISGNVAHGIDAYEVTDAIRASGALAFVRLESLKPLTNSKEDGFTFVVLGRAEMPHNS
jgi:hypothetical protein